MKKPPTEAIVIFVIFLVWGLFFWFLPELEVAFLRIFKFIDY